MGKIVITGASSEIGRAIVEELAGLGKPMLLQCHKNRKQLSRWEREAEILEVDFSCPQSLEHFLSHLKDIDILVNAAAYTYTELLPQLTEEVICKMVEINILSLVKICRTVIPSMCIRRKGIIVNLSSVAASRVYRGQSVYGGTKAFMETFSKAIAAEYGKKGIRCNCIAPGGIASGQLELLSRIAGNELKQFNAMQTTGIPRDVASTVAFLCEPKNKYINGTVIHVDGGQWMGV